MTEKISIKVNGKEVRVAKETFLLAALREAGFHVPTLCHHRDLTPSGNCRLCICEIELKGKKKFVTACNYPVREPLEARTDTEEVKQHRRILAEMVLGRWPNVRAVQEIAKQCGVTSSRLGSELTDDNPNACILCSHCVRACREFMMEEILDFAGRGIKRHLTMPFGQVDRHCVGCTSCAYVCPTGAIEIVDDKNNPVDPVRIRNHGMKVNAEMATLDKVQCRMREVGTANIVDVMNQYDLLPVHNFKFGKHPEAWRLETSVLKSKYFTQGHADGCWMGCSMACAKAVDDFELKTGPYRGERVTVDGPEYETAAASANMGCFDADFCVEFNFYCDTYGVDTISVGTTTAFIMEAFEAGVIDEKDTGGLKLAFGATNEVLELLHQMAVGKGFGVEAGQGIRWLKKKWSAEGKDSQFLEDIGMEVKGLEFSEYVTKESLAQQGGYGLAVKGPQHDEAWLIFMDMVNNQIPTFEDKAEALHFFPLWRTWFGLLGLCKIVWNDVVPADNYREEEPNKVPDHMRNYFNFFEGMTGIKVDEDKMIEQSARVYNLQRVLCRMLGFGTREHDRIPYRAAGPVTVEEYASRAGRYDKQLKEKIGIDTESTSTEEKVKLLRDYRMDQYEKLMDAVYKRRGWTQNGVPKIETLKNLGIDLPELVAIIKDDQ
ncbi:MAG: aldehyde ferredoxin oxidoreductase C-terminal domain-containing protein [Pseudomonadota bacterium]